MFTAAEDTYWRGGRTAGAASHSQLLLSISVINKINHKYTETNVLV